MIKDFEAKYLEIPFPEPGVESSTRGVLKNWGFTIVKISTDEGIVGVGGQNTQMPGGKYFSKILEETSDTVSQKLRDVVFNPEVRHDDSEEALLSTTPADLASSDKLTWKYIVKDGNVWEVNDQNEVDSVLGKS